MLTTLSPKKERENSKDNFEKTKTNIFLFFSKKPFLIKFISEDRHERKISKETNIQTIAILDIWHMIYVFFVPVLYSF